MKTVSSGEGLPDKDEFKVLRVTAAHGGRSGVYGGSAGPGPGGRKGGQRADRRTEGRAGGRKRRTGGRGVLNDSTTMFTDFHKKTSKNIMFSDFSSHAEAQVPIFTA